MTRDNIVFATCGLLLGLIVGSLFIGPRFAQSKIGGLPARESAMESGVVPSAAPASPGGAVAGGNPMEAVRNQLATLKQTIEKDPRNFAALAQLGNMYMDAAKYQQAIGYYERALQVREEPSLRTDLGICLKQAGQLDKALAEFRSVAREKPDEWQALFNEAIVLMEMRRIPEARVIVAGLRQSRPDDAEVQRLSETISGAR